MESPTFEALVSSVKYINVEDAVYALADMVGRDYDELFDSFLEHCTQFSFGDACMTLISLEDFVVVLRDAEIISEEQAKIIHASVGPDVYINLEN